MKKVYLLLFTFSAFYSFGQNGLNFDGTDDEVQTTYGGVFGSADRTFEAWVYVSANAPLSNLTITDYGTNSAGDRNTFVVAGDRSLRYLSGGTNGNINSGPSVVPTAQWTHVAFVLDNGTGLLYVNGVQQITGNLSGVTTPTSGENLKIGERVAGGSIRFEGSIDEVRIWDVARSATQLLADMNVEYCVPPTGLKAYYKLNEGVAGGTNTTVLTAVDAISSNNGTLSGFALTGTTSNWVVGSGITIGSVVNTQNVSICPGTSYTVGTSTYSTSGTYNDTLFGQGTSGCDSVVTTNLSISSISDDTLSMTICSGDSTSIDGLTYYMTSGFHRDTLTSTVTGCDSIITLDLIVLTLPSSSQSFTECAGFTITVGSNTYSTTGVYIDTFANAGANGCDSIVTTNLTINSPIDVTVTNSPSTLTITANNTSATSYQWIDCTTGLAIAGETNQTFTVIANGEYGVVISEGNCSDTSACTTYATIGLDDIEANNIVIYPNPSNGKVTISNITDLFKVYEIRVLNLLGQSVQTESNLTNSNYELNIEKKGVYFVEISQGNEQFRRKLIVK